MWSVCVPRDCTCVYMSTNFQCFKSLYSVDTHCASSVAQKSTETEPAVCSEVINTHTDTHMHMHTCIHTPDTQELLSLSFKVGTKACSRWLRQRQHADSLSHTPHALSFTHTHTSYMYTPSLHCQAPYEHLNRLKGFVCHVILQPCDLTAEPAHQGHMQGAKM